jgi:hypothetical protein
LAAVLAIVSLLEPAAKSLGAETVSIVELVRCKTPSAG